MTRICVAFDLDDTLYKERDFVRSGRRAVAARMSAQSGIDADELYGVMCGSEDAFGALLDRLSATSVPLPDMEELLDIYRFHMPSITLSDETMDVLAGLVGAGVTLGLVTDGRSRTQWNKIEALGLCRFIDRGLMIVSGDIGADKTTPKPFEELAGRVRADKYVYVGDNPAKDFHYSGLMGWTTVMLRDVDGVNVHKQALENLPDEYYPAHVIDNLSEITKYIS